MKAKKLYFTETHVAGRQYHDCDEVFEELKVGTGLRLERENNNCHDSDAVQFIYDKVDDEGKTDSFLIGYIPRSENSLIAGFLDMGWGEMFDCRISRINPDSHYEQQIRVVIKIKRNPREEQ